MIPLTPPAVRPITRTSFSSIRNALPFFVASTSSSLPDVIITSITQSSSAKVIARFPFWLIRVNSESEVFFTTPRFVAIKIDFDVSLKSFNVNIAVIWSSGVVFIKFLIISPFAVRDA